MELREELSRLGDLRVAIQGSAFQEYIMKPLYKELDEMKAAYSCTTLRELSRLQGKREGLEFIIHRLKIADEDYKSKKQELDAS